MLCHVFQVLVEKLGTSDKTTSHKLCEQRRSNPDDAPTPVCGHYCGRLEQLALLEFDRDRKSMSVLCKPTPSTRHTSKCVWYRWSRGVENAGPGWKMIKALCALAFV